MKLPICIVICLSAFSDLFAQSVILQPDAFQLPRLAQNPACTVADKGKQVFNTTQNKVFYCNGTSWINAENGTVLNVSPAFGGSNNNGQTLTTDSEAFNLVTEDYDIRNNFNPANAETYPNSFVSPDNGIYDIRLRAKLRFTNFTPNSSTRIVILMARYQPGGSVFESFEFPVRSNDADTYFQFSKVMKIPAQHRIVLSVKIEFPPASGSLRMEYVSLNGHLISWY